MESQHKHFLIILEVGWKKKNSWQIWYEGYQGLQAGVPQPRFLWPGEMWGSTEIPWLRPNPWGASKSHLSKQEGVSFITTLHLETEWGDCNLIKEIRSGTSRDDLTSPEKKAGFLEIGSQEKTSGLSLIRPPLGPIKVSWLEGVALFKGEEFVLKPILGLENWPEYTFQGSRLEGVHFQGSRLEGVDFQGSRLEGVHFQGSEFT